MRNNHGLICAGVSL